MGYWGEVSSEAWRDTRAMVRLDHPARIALTIGGMVAAGGLTWWATGGIAWSAVAAPIVLVGVGAVYFGNRLARIPAERDTKAQAALNDVSTALQKLEHPEDDLIPYVSLAAIANESGIPIQRYGPAQNNTFYLEGALQQAAARSKLYVEGRQYRGDVRHNDPLLPIPPDHFRLYGFLHGLFGWNADNSQSATSNLEVLLTINRTGIKDVTYYDIYVSDHQARAVITAFASDPRIVTETALNFGSDDDATLGQLIAQQNNGKR